MEPSFMESYLIHLSNDRYLFLGIKYLTEHIDNNTANTLISSIEESLSE